MRVTSWNCARGADVSRRRAPRTYHPYMSNGDLHWIANYIWGIADDVLRDLYVPTGTSSCR